MLLPLLGSLFNRRDRRSRGQTLVEFAFVFILFIGLMVAVIGSTRLVLAYFALSNAAAEGARVGAVQNTANSVVAAKVQETTGMAVGISFTVPNTALSAGTCSQTNAICICRHRQGNNTCLDPATAVRGDLIDVWVTYDMQLMPGEPSPNCGGAGWCVSPIMPNTTIRLTGFGQARIE